MKRLLPAIILLITFCSVSVIAQDCPKYKKVKKTIVTSSTRGQLSDTGWLELLTFNSCDPVNTTAGSPVCNTVTIPGESVGVGDEIITTCVYDKTICIDKCNCKASDATSQTSISFPKFNFLKSKLEAVAKTAPMIKKISLSVSGSVSKKSGETCCLPDNTQPPVKYDEYSGTVSGGIAVELNIPGWSWSLNDEWNGIYRVKAEISLGPIISLSPSLSASVAGRMYQDNLCPACVTTGLSGSIGLGVKFAGTLECNVWLFEGSYWEFSGQFQLAAELGLSSSISLSGTYNWDGCPKPGLSGSFGYGGLKGYGKASATVWGTSISFTKEVTLLDGVSIPF